MEKVEVNSERWFSLADLNDEEWRNIPNSYCMISNYGRLKRLEYEKDIYNQSVYRHYRYEERILKATLSPLGYYHTRIIIKNKLTDVRINRLVAEAFVPNPKHLPHVNHKNEISTDNVATNLEWCTPEYNNNYGTARQRLVATRKNREIDKWHNIIQYSLTGEHTKTFLCKSDLVNSGFKYRHIARCCEHKIPSAYGYVWRYDDDKFSIEHKTKSIQERDNLGRIAPQHVIQYSKEGVFIREFNSIKDAATAMNGNHVYISCCCRGKCPTAYGYIWRKKGEQAPKPYKNKKERTIMQYTQDGVFIAEYPSLKQASIALNNDTKKWTSIWECCVGKAKTYKGFIWKYKEK